MNLERGVRRITVVVSVVTGLGVWVLSSTSLLDGWAHDREEHVTYKKKYENIRLFWELWDANGWDFGKSDKSDVLPALVASRWHRVTFTTDTTNFALSGCEVLPGMDAATLDLPSAAFAKLVQRAREDGLNKAFGNVWRTESSWTRRSQLELLAFGVVFAVPAGAGAFIAVWLLFFLFRWIGRGFCAATRQASVEGESGHFVFASTNDSPEETEKRCGSDVPPDVVQTAE